MGQKKIPPTVIGAIVESAPKVIGAIGKVVKGIGRGAGKVIQEIPSVIQERDRSKVSSKRVVAMAIMTLATLHYTKTGQMDWWIIGLTGIAALILIVPSLACPCADQEVPRIIEQLPEEDVL